MADSEWKGRATPAGLRRSGAIASVAAGVLLFATLPCEGAWTPPAKPDPDKILSQAQDDAAAGRYADALAEHVWFHENALTYAPAMSGVRLSFALGYWAALGAKYPPARQKLRAIRDRNDREVRSGGDDVGPSADCEGPGVRRAFNDFSAINRALGDDARTSALFVWLDANHPRVATAVYDVAEQALIGAKEYRLCSKYLRPEESFRRALLLREEAMKATTEFGGDPDDVQRLKELNEEMFVRSAATLVALLAINDRKAEAERIAAQAEKAGVGGEMSRQLAKALAGEVPQPWP